MNRRRMLWIALLSVPALVACGRADTPPAALVPTPAPTVVPAPTQTPAPLPTPPPTGDDSYGYGYGVDPVATPLPDASKPESPRQPDLIPVSPIQPGLPGSVSLPAPYDPQLNQRIDAAKQDLAQRLGIDIATIQVLQVLAVTWPDGALGCPKPDMAYPQVLIDGVQVQLRAGDRTYAYHGANDGDLFLCE